MKNKDFISICPQCFCITHTIKGMCGKCNAAKEYCGNCYYPDGGVCDFAGEISMYFWCKNWKENAK